jgi:uncharacterized membrane protein
MWFAALLGCLTGKVANKQERRWGRRAVPPRQRKRSASYRPRLEGLEDRIVPSGGYDFTTIDDPNGTRGGVALGINSRGDIVGQYADANFVGHGFLLSHGEYTTLDDPNGVNGTSPAAINASGQIVGTYVEANFVGHLFLLSGGQYTTLPDPNNGYRLTQPQGINNSGQIVGYYIDANFVGHGFLLSGGQYTTLDDPNALPPVRPRFTIAQGISDSGKIVGYYFDGNFVHGFLATPSQHGSAASAPSPAVHPGNAGVMERSLPLRTAALDHARLLRVQESIEAGEFGGVLGQSQSHTVPGSTTPVVTVPTRNGDATGLKGHGSDTPILNGQGSGSRILFAAATRSTDLNAIEFTAFDRKDSSLDPGLFVP